MNTIVTSGFFSSKDVDFTLRFPGIINIGTLSVQELFFQLIGWLGVELGVSPVGMVYFMG